MARINFEVSRDKDSASVKLTWDTPVSVTDDRWAAMGFTPADVNAAAIRSAKIDMQRAVREAWVDGGKGKIGEPLKVFLQAAVDGWKRGATRTAPAPIVNKKAGKFTAEQVAYLQGIGVKVE